MEYVLAFNHTIPKMQEGIPYVELMGYVYVYIYIHIINIYPPSKLTKMLGNPPCVDHFPKETIGVPYSF